MKQSSPWHDKFFKLNGSIDLLKLKKVLIELNEKYFTSPSKIYSIKSDSVTYTLDNLSEIDNFFDKIESIEFLQFALNENGLMFNIVIQCNNNGNNSNGNLRVMLGTKENNNAAEMLIMKELNLVDLSDIMKKQLIQVDPIFQSRTFNDKDKSIFVLMPFGEKWSNRLWILLQEIADDNHFECKRADNLYGHDVLEDIWLSINSASHIIADMSGKNPNVMYEIGIAHTLGKKTILLSQDDDSIPFDFKRFRILLYEDNTDGFAKIKTELPNYLLGNVT